MFENLKERLSNLAIESITMRGDIPDLKITVDTYWGERYVMDFTFSDLINTKIEEPYAEELIISSIRRNLNDFRKHLGERN